MAWCGGLGDAGLPWAPSVPGAGALPVGCIWCGPLVSREGGRLPGAR